MMHALVSDESGGTRYDTYSKTILFSTLLDLTTYFRGPPENDATCDMPNAMHRKMLDPSLGDLFRRVAIWI